jgi:hypothetical protein
VAGGGMLFCPRRAILMHECNSASMFAKPLPKTSDDTHQSMPVTPHPKLRLHAVASPAHRSVIIAPELTRSVHHSPPLRPCIHACMRSGDSSDSTINQAKCSSGSDTHTLPLTHTVDTQTDKVIKTRQEVSLGTWCSCPACNGPPANDL